MLLAGINFTLHYQLWVERKLRSIWKDIEVRFYLIMVGVVTLVVSTSLVWQNHYPGYIAIRRALFQVSSIMTTTGFITDDFEQWFPLPQLMLLVLMFIGGCTGSTAGGLKSYRILLLFKVVNRVFKKIIEPKGIFSVRVGSQVIPESTIQSLLNLVYLSFLINFAGCLLLASSGVDVMTSIASVAATMFNIGPGLGNVGPLENYGHLPSLAKWVLSSCMLAGRLEFYTVLVIFIPAFWRK